MTARHTPGPWRVEPHRNGNDALISGRGDPDTDGGECEWQEFARVVVRMDGVEKDEPEGLANAKLIAAAPQLADALERLSPLAFHSIDCDREAGECECGLASVLDEVRAALRAAGRLP